MLSLAKAKQAIEASEKKAQELGITVSTAIVDDHGDLIALSRMDDALFTSPEFAFTKAFTATRLRFPTGDLGQYAREGKAYYGINTLFGGKLTPMAGGLPIVRDGKTVGAVGVGGSQNTEDDVKCAQEAKNILETAHTGEQKP